MESKIEKTVAIKPIYGNIYSTKRPPELLNMN